MLLSVPEVDVVKDWLDYTNLLIGLGGFASAIVAIWLARRAQRSADTAITEERRRVFELDILRELARDLDEPRMALDVFNDPAVLARYRLRLDLLSAELPFWEQLYLAPGSTPGHTAVIEAVGLDDEIAKITQRYEELGKQISELEAEPEGTFTIDRSSGRPMYRIELKDSEKNAQRDALSAERSQLMNDKQDVWAHAVYLVRHKLSYDVRQAIESLVLAGRAPRLSWWKRRWWFRV